MTKQTAFCEGWYWFKFNSLGLALGTNLRFHISVANGLKLKVRRFLELIPTFVENTGKKLVGRTSLEPLMLNRVKNMTRQKRGTSSTKFNSTGFDQNIPQGNNWEKLWNDSVYKDHLIEMTK